MPATWRDLNALRKLEKICFPKDVWPIFDLIGVLTLPKVVRLKAIVAQELVGFIAADIRPSQGMAWIATIAVLPGYRRQGIGRALLSTCEAQLQVPNVRLNVRMTNKVAIGLYRSAGYKEVGTWPNYYNDREHALVMEKSLREF
jgi:ribosomal-protein-alanine N-acetyltransferase